jgi:phosphatidylserine decarboxylase
VITARSWQVATHYVMPPLAVGLALAAARQRYAIAPLAFAGAVLLFFRDPDRALTADRSLVYAAADGIVTGVEQAQEPWLPFRHALRITTFLTLFNVHVARSPIGGTVVEQRDLEGSLAPALSSRAEANRQSRLVIDSPHGDAGVVLIAGAIARRITHWVGAGDHVPAGGRLALIHFGSRTDVLLPADSTESLVRPGSRVVGGRTPIARRSLRSPA